ncbi:MAG: hypothetical protein QF886_14895 [Planctomycetota bacterium]|nr:hypothetical protein [Planctomycetota bacterium]
MIETLTIDLCFILIAAFLSGLVCRKIGASPVVGYLLVGAALGRSGFGAVSDSRGEIEILAHGGVLLHEPSPGGGASFIVRLPPSAKTTEAGTEATEGA